MENDPEHYAAAILAITKAKKILERERDELDHKIDRHHAALRVLQDMMGDESAVQSNTRVTALEKLLTLVRSHPGTLSELNERVSYSKKSLSVYLSRLRAEGKVSNKMGVWTVNN